MTELPLRIDDIGRKGEGVAHHEGNTYFVPGTLPGEEVRALGDGQHVSALSILRRSPERIDAFCKHYGACGGCQLQHWREEPYRAWKAGTVEKQLAARGIEAKVSMLIDAHGAGRRRVSIHARRAGGKVIAGFMTARSHALLDIDGCPILEPRLSRAFDIARGLGARLGDCDVALTATASGIDASVKAQRKVAEKEHAGLAGLIPALALARLSVNGEIVATAASPLVVMGRADVPLPPGSFLQATAEGEAVLARLAVEGLGKFKHAADLFSGIGPFTFRLAERARVEAFDSDRSAIAALNAAANSTSGLKPISGSVRDLFRSPLVVNELKDFDAVVFDPPRAGAEAQAQQLAKSDVKTVAAVSCDARTFARDAGFLLGGGYRLRTLTAIDQFKWSSHVEMVGIFAR